MKRLLFFIYLLPSILLAQHSIKGKFSPAKEYNFALLYKVTPTLSEYISNTEIDKETGCFEFQLDSTKTKGMYRVVYAIPQEDYNFDIIYNGKEDIELTFNSETGVTFKKSDENKLLASYTNSMSMVTQSIGNYFREESKNSKALKSIFKTQQETQENFEKAAEGMMALDFIKANQPYVPTEFEDLKTYINNLRVHYFDHINFNSKTLQSSNFLEEKMLNYVFGMSSKIEDEATVYKNNIDVFHEILKTTPQGVKRILLVDLWQQMADLGFESVANYISDKYLMPVAKSLNDKDLIDGLTLFKNTSIGRKAPDFTLEIKKDKKLVKTQLSALDIAQTYVVVFWSSTCSHCLDEIPQLQSFVQSLDKGLVQVVAVGLEDDPYKWKDLTYTYPSFIHVYGEGKWDNKIGNDYGVTATPTYFILDKDKKIISKPEDFKVLQAFFGQETDEE
ncbi:TlpA family protein disulfide reductase [Algibacter sp. L1A34]|uniref:TlpA family protein disulfide reductase n=1 Tax=Algibacter sp. L1A34 TaxID=2686365 RepID=UPI00131C8740|nr:TlpA disulfide reductase family protein [Algibacter sp. L1A34]